VSVERALVVAGLADERARDYAPDRMLIGQNLARRAARGVQLIERNRLLVCGDLKDGIGRRVDDPLPGALVLLAELLNDLSSGRRLVPEHAAARAMHERIDHVVRKSLRVRRQRPRRHDAHQFPVPCRRVLPG
jgi:hypothetical protein